MMTRGGAEEGDRDLFVTEHGIGEPRSTAASLRVAYEGCYEQGRQWGQ
jgi:hypothetical protein